MLVSWFPAIGRTHGGHQREGEPALSSIKEKRRGKRIQAPNFVFVSMEYNGRKNSQIRIVPCDFVIDNGQAIIAVLNFMQQIVCLKGFYELLSVVDKSWKETKTSVFPCKFDMC